LEVLLVQTGRRNVDTPIGYLRQAALLREQCDITELCRQQEEVMQNHENANVHNIRNSEA
jgi:hypothetical protein